MVHYKIEVSGRVQGVGFRYSARNEAVRLGIKGFVKNLPGGHVYLEIEGSPEQTDKMIQWCRTGPSTGWVDNLQLWQGELVGFENFSIR